MDLDCLVLEKSCFAACVPSSFGGSAHHRHVLVRLHTRSIDGISVGHSCSMRLSGLPHPLARTRGEERKCFNAVQLGQSSIVHL